MAGAFQMSHCHQGNQAPCVQTRRGGIEPTVKGHWSATKAFPQGLRIRDLLHKAPRTEHLECVAAFRHAGGIIGIVAGRGTGRGGNWKIVGRRSTIQREAPLGSRPISVWLFQSSGVGSRGGRRRDALASAGPGRMGGVALLPQLRESVAGDLARRRRRGHDLLSSRARGRPPSTRHRSGLYAPPVLPLAPRRSLLGCWRSGAAFAARWAVPESGLVRPATASSTSSRNGSGGIWRGSS